MELIHIQEVKTVYSFEEFKHYVLMDNRLKDRKNNKAKCLELLNYLIKKYRYDLINTFSGYKIILNGLDQFLSIKLDTSCPLFDHQTKRIHFKAEYVLDKLEILLDKAIK